MRFANKAAIITGGATGIGLAAARRLGLEGAKVAIAGRRGDVGEEAAAQLQEAGIEAAFFRCDVSVLEEVERLMEAVQRQYGAIDILVNNAAYANTIDFLSPETERWRHVFDVTVNGTYYCSRAAALVMAQQAGGGRIINVSSINGYRALEGSSHYNAGKGAMDQLTRCMAAELAPLGIRVNGIAPGFIDTAMSVIDGENELETDWFKSIYVERRKIPVARAGLPEEVAAVIAFLASEDASYLCGAILPVDGGLSITF